MNAQAHHHRQRGLASLTTVMLLFFVVALLAAYTNRNLIFEQRSAGNQYRSTQAFEAAEAGVEWALSMLNTGRIDAACTPSDDPADGTFRQRYLAIDASSGVIDPAGAMTPDFASTTWPGCVFDGADWACSCPTAAAPALAAPAGAGVFPAFRVRFSRVSTTQPGVVRLEVNGCTRPQGGCLDFPSKAVAGEGRATVSALIALRSGLPAPPVAALTVQGEIDVGGAALGAFNVDAAAGGIGILAGGSVNTAHLRLGSAPGTPGEAALRADDTVLAALPAGHLFTSTFAIWPDLYREQPGAVVLDCRAGCNAQDVRDAATANPGRVLWLDGDLDLDASGDVGSAATPLLLVATGDVSIGATLHGLLFVRKARWTSGAGAGVVRGAVVADGSLAGAGAFSVVYDAEVLSRLRRTTGSFVRVPGGWKDF